jgi:hypothetical protein
MTWLLWRQHRLQLALAAAALACFAVPIWITGRHLTTALQSCRADSSCGGFDLFRGYGAIVDIVLLTMTVPLLIGVFWGATLVGRELETGTATLAWTQSRTRRQWQRARLATLFGAATACSAAVTGLATWWSDTHNATVESRFSGAEFDVQGVVPIAYTLFAAALGLAAGVIWRRVLPAMATTIGGFVGVRLLLELALRPHYMAPVTKTASMGVMPDPPSGSWAQGTDLLLHGRVIQGAVRVPATCTGTSSRDAMSRCMDGLGYRVRMTYQPAGRYWTFQWIEFGIFAALAAALVVIAIVLLRRCDA